MEPKKKKKKKDENTEMHAQEALTSMYPNHRVLFVCSFFFPLPLLHMQLGRPVATDIDNGIGDTQLLVLLITPG